jgi:hypothetical protein
VTTANTVDIDTSTITATDGTGNSAKASAGGRAGICFGGQRYHGGNSNEFVYGESVGKHQLAQARAMELKVRRCY